MLSILGLGFLIGMQHALEADHVAAVASLATKNQTLKQAIKQGSIWGLGHSIALLIVGAFVIMLDTVLPETVAHWLEFTVGIMLVVLGVDVMRRLIKDRVHFHLHKHETGKPHIHAHSHRGEGAHEASSHAHRHPKGITARVLAVGLMHGMAGSAALLLLVAGTLESPTIGILYIVLFGVGSIVGMAVLSAVISVPLRYSAKSMTWAYNGIQGTIGIATIMLGAYTMYSLGIA
jgi:ABC-type nickel/cobalt efflux system permease component RcnA